MAVNRSSIGFGALVLVAVCAIVIVVWVASPEDELSGEELFRTEFTPKQGLGPLFNQRACSVCHAMPEPGGVGRNGLETELRVGRLTDAGFDPMEGRGGPVAPAHSISELGVACDRTPVIPAGANVTSVRNTPSLFGSGLIDAIPDEVIRAGAVARDDGVSGRPNLVRGPDGRERVGRFGWKAQTATLDLFVAQALRDELGLTSQRAPAGSVPAGTSRCGESGSPEVAEDDVAALTDFVATLPARRPRRSDPAGGVVFKKTGCASCHTPSLRAGAREVPLYSDLLLHDMGRALDDRVVQGSAGGPDWRTAPLWGLADRTRYLHDGRADSLEAAILAHGGEAEKARQRFRSLSPAQRRRLLAFLRNR
jgi:CxxC motif-containing protein (DUF1111 family)